MVKKLFVELRVELYCCIRGDILRTAGKYGFIIALAEEIKSYPLIYIIAALAGILFFVKCIAMHNIPLLKGKP
jgi:hypothetical protein